MAAAHVQHKSDSSWAGGSSVSVAFDSNPTAGNLICGFVSWLGTVTLDSVTDSLSNSYTLVNNPTVVGDRRAATFYAMNVTGGACTVTATFSGSLGGNAVSIVIHEASGCAISSALDGNTIGSDDYFDAGTDVVTSGAVTPTLDGAYLAGFVMCAGTQTWSAGTGWTGRANATGNPNVASESYIQGTAASIAATFSATNSGWLYPLAGIMAFKVAAGATSVPVFMNQYRQRRA